MSISFKVEDVSISAKRDRAMFNTFAANNSYIIQGIGDELLVTSSSSSFVVSLGTGEAVICGGSMLSEGSATTLTLQENQSGYIVIRIDLSQTGENICQFTNVSSLVQENINNNGLIYDLPLYRYTTNGSGVSTINDVREITSSSLSYIPTPTIDTTMSASSTNPVQNKVINSALAGKAPTNHRSSGTSYGLGTTSYYGHVKTINALTQESHADGTALSAYQGYVLKQSIDTLSSTVSGKANTSHAHGDITSGGDITTNATIANGDRLIINDESESKLANSTITFDGSTTTSLLSRKGTWTTAKTLFQVLFPVGSIYATSTNTNPSAIIGGTWTLLNSTGKVDVGGTIKGNGKVLGIRDGSYNGALVSTHYAYNGAWLMGMAQTGKPEGGSATTLIGTNLNTTDYTTFGGSNLAYRKIGITTTASQSGIIADTVTCYLWQRTE